LGGKQQFPRIDLCLYDLLIFWKCTTLELRQQQPLVALPNAEYFPQTSTFAPKFGALARKNKNKMWLALSNDNQTFPMFLERLI
jgi:hypothetical protein